MPEEMVGVGRTSGGGAEVVGDMIWGVRIEGAAGGRNFARMGE